MRRSRYLHFRNQAGFTLVELLLALLMFAIIVGAIFAAFAAIVDGVERGRQGNDLQRVARGTMQRLIQEIGSAFHIQVQCLEDSPSYVCEPLKGENAEVEGVPQDRIMFLTIPYRRFPDGVPASELCNVCYYIAANAQRVPVLFRYEDCTLDDKDDDRCSGEHDPVEMTETATSLDITYYAETAEAESTEAEATEATSEVYDAWPPNDPDGALPGRVHVALTLQRPGGSPWTFATMISLPMQGKSNAGTTSSTISGQPGLAGQSGLPGQAGRRGGLGSPGERGTLSGANPPPRR